MYFDYSIKALQWFLIIGKKCSISPGWQSYLILIAGERLHISRDLDNTIFKKRKLKIIIDLSSSPWLAIFLLLSTFYHGKLQTPNFQVSTGYIIIFILFYFIPLHNDLIT